MSPNPMNSGWQIGLIFVLVLVAAVAGFGLAHGVFGMVQGSAQNSAAPTSHSQHASGGSTKQPAAPPTTKPCTECEQRNLATP